MNLVVLKKGHETYAFLFDDAHREDTICQLGRFAADPDLSFQWYDAAVVSQRIRHMPATNATAIHHEERTRNHWT